MSYELLHKRWLGEMAERSKAAVLKTVEGNPLPGFESLSLLHNNREVV
jgi:hypothetical protein